MNILCVLFPNDRIRDRVALFCLNTFLLFRGESSWILYRIARHLSNLTDLITGQEDVEIDENTRIEDIEDKFDKPNPFARPVLFFGLRHLETISNEYRNRLVDLFNKVFVLENRKY